jgi:SAM-dependent methyltransferase
MTTLRVCLVLLVSVTAFSGAAGAQTPDERAWADFLQWLKAAPQASGPLEILSGYRAAVQSRGLPPVESDRQLTTVMRLMRDRNDAWPLIFDSIYASRTPNFSTAPSPLSMAAVDGRAPGRALDVGMGQGRNAVALARKGWDVTGIDISDEGLAVSRANAALAGVTVTAVHASDVEFDHGRDRWDLIAVIYGPGSTTDERFAGRLYQALRTGGIVVVESFASPKEAARRRPVDIDPADLLRAFAGFRLLRFEDAEGTSEWDPQPTSLVRMIAQKRR